MSLIMIKRGTAIVLCGLILLYGVVALAEPTSTSMPTIGTLSVNTDLLAHPPVTEECINCHPTEIPAPPK